MLNWKLSKLINASRKMRRRKMKLISWNVNGIRACVTKGFMDFFNDLNGGQAIGQLDT